MRGVPAALPEFCCIVANRIGVGARGVRSEGVICPPNPPGVGALLPRPEAPPIPGGGGHLNEKPDPDAGVGAESGPPKLPNAVGTLEPRLRLPEPLPVAPSIV